MAEEKRSDAHPSPARKPRGQSGQWSASPARGGQPRIRRDGKPGAYRAGGGADRGGATDQGADRGPSLSPKIEARQLDPEVRRELTTLDKVAADFVARHLVAAGELIDEDPAAALEHARAARARSGRIPAVREAVGIAAYHCGDWAQALTELRAARRMGSKSPLLAMIADCERGVGRPERAIELARGAEATALAGPDADELRIVIAGAYSDLGRFDQALAILSSPKLNPADTGRTAARLFYAYAETLLALGRREDAVQWFIHAAAADIDGFTDAEDRVTELA